MTQTGNNATLVWSSTLNKWIPQNLVGATLS